MTKDLGMFIKFFKQPNNQPIQLPIFDQPQNYQFIIQPIKLPIYPSTNQITNLSLNQSTEQLITQSIKLPINHPINQINN